jgi:ABC-type transporter Mla subunit MlaD
MPVVKKRADVLVGLFLFTGLALLGGLILQFGKFSERLRGHYTITVVFNDASGVINGSEVRMGGAKIGQVAILPELNEAVQVEVQLSLGQAIRVPAGSTFEIQSATLLGDKLIAIIPPQDRSHGFIEPGSRIQGADPSSFNAIQNQAETLVREFTQVLKQAETMLVKVDAGVDEIRGASRQFGEAVGKINGSLLADKNLSRFDRTLENLASITAQWKTTSDKLEPTLAEARDAIQAIQKAANGAEKSLQSADRTMTELTPVFSKIPQAVDDFASTSRKAGNALDRMARGEGLLGALANDNDVALDAKGFMRNLRQYGILLYRNPEPKAAGKTADDLRPHFGGPRR